MNLLAPFTRWIFGSVLFPLVEKWFLEKLAKAEEDADFQAKARSARIAYEDAKTRQDKSAARRALIDL